MFAYDAIVFDMDGVIFDSERLLLNCWVERNYKYNCDEIEKIFISRLGSSLAVTTKILSDALGSELIAQDFLGEVISLYNSKVIAGELKLKPGVVELLEYLKENHKKIVLASSSNKSVIYEQLRYYEIIDYFNTIISGDMVLNSKPYPDIYSKACESVGVIPQKAIALEDSVNGITSANKANMKTIMIPDLILPSAEIRLKADLVLEDLFKVKRYLQLCDAAIR